MFTFAYQTGSVQREVKNPADLIFEDGLISGGSSLDVGNISVDKKGYLDHVGGLRFTSKFNKTDEFFIGISAGRFGKPDWALVSGSSYRLNPRAIGQIGFSTR